MIKDITYCVLLLHLVLIKIFPRLYLEVSTGKISFLCGRNIEKLETKTKQERSTDGWSTKIKIDI